MAKRKSRKPARKQSASRSQYGSRPGRPDSSDRYYTKEDMFISRMASILMVSPKQAKSFFSQRDVSTIRLNNLANDPDDTLEKLHKNGAELTEVPWVPHGYIVGNMDKSRLGEMQEYSRGLFYIQNLSSMLPVVILDPQPGEKILDMTASPGSKTTMIAALTNNKADITANEEDFRRLGKLKSVLGQFHVKGVKTTHTDGRAFGKTHPQYFDKVLLDAPCSGEGLVYLRGQKPLRFWSIKKVKFMSKLQEELILSAFDALKPGGTLVYSTCTLEPDENEGVITHLIESRKDAHIEKIDLIDSPEFADYTKHIRKGITKWSGKKYHQEVGKTIRIIPSAKMQGFYIAKITKSI